MNLVAALFIAVAVVLFLYEFFAKRAHRNTQNLALACFALAVAIQLIWPSWHNLHID